MILDNEDRQAVKKRRRHAAYFADVCFRLLSLGRSDMRLEAAGVLTALVFGLDTSSSACSQSSTARPCSVPRDKYSSYARRAIAA